MVSKEQFYERVTELIKSKGMTIAEFERKAGLSNGSVGKWKINRPLMSTVEKVAEALEVNPVELLKEE